METKHTPAPWYPVEFAGVYLLLDSNDYAGKNLFDSDEVGKEKAIANVKLAAASRELLEVLIKSKKLIGDFRLKKEVPTQEIWEEIEHIINKATK